MASKPVLYYTHAKDWGTLKVLAVTTDKGRRLWGRYPDGETTHTLKQYTTGRYATFEAAESAMSRVRAVQAEYAAKVKVLDDQRRVLQHQEEAAIAAIRKETEQ